MGPTQLNQVHRSMNIAAQLNPSAFRSNTRVRSTLALTPGAGEESSDGRASLWTAVRSVDARADEVAAKRDSDIVEKRATPMAVSCSDRSTRSLVTPNRRWTSLTFVRSARCEWRYRCLRTAATVWAAAGGVGQILAAG